ncbi:hypothetical protein EFA46_014575 (plasmid) [Halarchaeum sp. CBA1220]|uniref:hypothetical protein n=1 Tax=Halarchaeum sp. CBA1220 TaxID=1853682 RepID=UPI0011CEB882|nr:hypothetical protein [Halarchaeum sp. CBA1220]QLC35469.1 hypothetical protein EFA46_014575 [Halarchaeum sp. CBA1220]
MNGVQQIVSSFGERRKNSVWLPTLTLAYLYHLTGDWMYIFSGAVSCCGAMVLYDLATEILGEGDTRKNSRFTSQDVLSVIPRVPDESMRFVFLWFSIVSYPISLIYAVIELVHHFDHSNLILVGLGSAYLGFVLTFVFNGPFIFRHKDTKEDIDISDIWPYVPEKYEGMFDEVLKEPDSEDETDTYEPHPGYQ